MLEADTALSVAAYERPSQMTSGVFDYQDQQPPNIFQPLLDASDMFQSMPENIGFCDSFDISMNAQWQTPMGGNDPYEVRF